MARLHTVQRANKQSARQTDVRTDRQTNGLDRNNIDIRSMVCFASKGGYRIMVRWQA